MTTKSDKPDRDVKQLEELMDKVSDAEAAEAERHVRSAEGQRALRELQEHSEQVIREARQRALEGAAAGPPETGRPIPQRILAMTRDAILARLEELRDRFGGELAVQYRDLDDQSIDDLRSLLADVEAGLDDGGQGE